MNNINFWYKPVLLFFLLFFLTFLPCFGQSGTPFPNALKDSEGAIIRSDTTQKTVSLIFSADEFGEGAVKILDVLKEQKVPASFFLTGNFFRNPQFREVISRMRREGHYLGPHSDRHLLYNTWEKRDSLLVTRREFRRDLRGNLRELKRAGIPRRDVPWFLPPYEWYNSTICQWSEMMGLRVINFTSGTGTNADYTTPDMTSYKSSEQLMERLLGYEETHPLGLRGAILLIHLGTHPDRTDKFYDRLGDLIQELKSRGYKLEKF